jgi:hypothetical protein
MGEIEGRRVGTPCIGGELEQYLGILGVVRNNVTKFVKPRTKFNSIGKCLCPYFNHGGQGQIL